MSAAVAAVARASDRLLSLAARLGWLPPLLARVVLGVVFLRTGWGKLHSLDSVAQFFASLGIPAPALQAAIVAVVETVGGALLLAGLGARLAALPLAATMIVATATAQWPQAQSILMAGAPTGDVTAWAGHRLLDVALGCAIALVATYLLWPSDRETEETVPVPAT